MNDNKQNNYNEFRLSTQSKLILIFTCIVMIIIFAFILKKTNKNKSQNNQEDKNPIVHDNQKELEENNQDSIINDKNSSQASDNSLINDLKEAIPSNIDQFMNIFIDSSSDLESIDLEDKDSIIQYEKSYIYFQNEAYVWLPNIKLVTSNTLNNSNEDLNQYGKINSTLKEVFVSLNEITQEHYRIFNEENYVAIYNPQISKDYISHLEVINDNAIAIKATSFRDFDAHIYIKESALKSLQSSNNIIQNSDHVYLIKSQIDNNLQERVSKPEKKQLKNNELLELSRKDLDNISIESNAVITYMLSPTDLGEDLYYSFYLIDVSGDNYVVVDIYKSKLYYLNRKTLMS